LARLLFRAIWPAPTCVGLIPGGDWLGHPVPNAPNTVEKFTSNNVENDNKILPPAFRLDSPEFNVVICHI
jgi:hypothetical protein